MPILMVFLLLKIGLSRINLSLKFHYEVSFFMRKTSSMFSFIVLLTFIGDKCFTDKINEVTDDGIYSLACPCAGGLQCKPSKEKDDNDVRI